MAEIALSGALALVDRLLRIYPYVTHDIEEVKNLMDTLKGFLKDTDGREDTEGLKNSCFKFLYTSILIRPGKLFIILLTLLRTLFQVFNCPLQ